MTAHNNVPEQFTFPARHLYAARSFRLEQKVADLDMLANTFMRAPGESVGTFALECAIDELAHDMRIDPIELRRRWEPGARSDQRLAALVAPPAQGLCRRRGALRLGPARCRARAARRDGEWLVGMGVATATYPYYRMPGVRARVRLDADDGHVTVSTAGHEMGMGTATVQAQHAADRLGVTLEDVSFEYGDSRLPAGAMAGGSSQTAARWRRWRRRPRRCSAQAAEARRQRQSAGRAEDRRRGGAGRRAGARQGSGAARKLRLDPARARSATASRPRKADRCRWSR